MSTDITINEQQKKDSFTYAKNIKDQYKASIEEYEKMINKGTICWSKKILHKNIYDIFELILTSKIINKSVLDNLKQFFGITISRSSDDTFKFQPTEFKKEF